MSNRIEMRHDIVLQYLVVSPEGEVTWQGDNPARAIEAYRELPHNSRVLVQGWERAGEGEIPTGRPIDVTSLIGAVRGGWVW